MSTQDKQIVGSESLLLSLDPVPTIISSLKEDVPIEKFRVKPNSFGGTALTLQEFLLDAMSFTELAMYTNSTNVPIITAPNMAYLRDDLADELSKEPDLLEKYDLYTWKNPDLWQRFVDIHWEAKRATSPKSRYASEFATRLEAFIEQKDFNGCDTYEVRAERDRYLNMASVYDLVRSNIPFMSFSRQSRSNRVQAKALKDAISAHAKDIASAISDLGHQYRRNYLASLKSD